MGWRPRGGTPYRTTSASLRLSVKQNHASRGRESVATKVAGLRLSADRLGDSGEGEFERLVGLLFDSVEYQRYAKRNQRTRH